MKGDNRQYWTWVKNQRLKDIEAETAIGNPDRELMQILLKELREAEDKIKEYSE